MCVCVGEDGEGMFGLIKILSLKVLQAFVFLKTAILSLNKLTSVSNG